MSDDFRIRFAFIDAIFTLQLVAQGLVVFDDAIVDQRQFGGCMRMCIGCCWRAMGRPARVRNADISGKRPIGKHLDQIGKLAFGAAPVQRAIVNRAKPGAVIAAIFHPLEPVDQTISDRCIRNDTNNSAHDLFCCPLIDARRSYTSTA